MLNLKSISSLWGTVGFSSQLKLTLEKMTVKELPLQQGLSFSNIALDSDVKVVILNLQDDADTIIVKMGIFYSGIVAGCNCSDDPSPIDTQNEYCEVLLHINKSSGDSTVNLISDD